MSKKSDSTYSEMNSGKSVLKSASVCGVKFFLSGTCNSSSGTKIFAEAEKAGLAAVQLDGEMLDYPVAEKARKILQKQRIT